MSDDTSRRQIVPIHRLNTALYITVALVVGLACGFLVGLDMQLPTARESPETTVTCYYDTSNTTSFITCPDVVEANGIRVRIKDCANYTYSVDEPHPCKIRNGSINLSKLPVDDG